MIKKNNITQAMLVNELQLQSEVFSGLDMITFSRWVNNRTSPSLEKQILVARYFETRLQYFIRNVDNPTSTMVIKEKFTTIFEKIQQPYHKISYEKSQITGMSLNLINVSKATHRSLFGNFYNKMDVYKRIFTKLDQQRQNITTTAFAIKQNGKIISHISCNKDFSKLTPHFIKPIHTPSRESVLINVGYYINIEVYETLIGHLFNYLIDQYTGVKECYVATRGNYFLDFLEQLGGKIVISSQEQSGLGNIHLFQFDLIQLYGQPLIFQKIQKYNASYLELKRHLTVKFPTPSNVSIDKPEFI